jgi:hypothetical protein
LSLFNDPDSELNIRESVLIAVGNIGSTPQGLLVLHEEFNLLDSILEFIPTATGSIKISALRTLRFDTHFISSCFLSNSASKIVMVDSISKAIFDRFSPRNPMDKLLLLAKSAVEEVSIAAFSSIKGAVCFEWGLNSLSVSSFDFLLARTSETPNIIKGLSIV